MDTVTVNIAWPYAKLHTWLAANDVQKKDVARMCGIEVSHFTKMIRGDRPVPIDFESKVWDAIRILKGDVPRKDVFTVAEAPKRPNRI